MVWNYSIFDHSLPCKQLWQTEPAFLLLLGDVTVEFMSPLHSVSLSLSGIQIFFFFYSQFSTLLPAIHNESHSGIFQVCLQLWLPYFS